MSGYARLFAMIATSVLAMYALTYATNWSFDHVTFSQTRVWMVLYMGATMAVIMLSWMWGMYEGEGRKIGILGASAALFVFALVMLRSQSTVDDVSWMKAMIPHHSIAILTSERAQISDPRVRELADEIIETQLREIAEMKELIADLETR